MTPDHFHTLAMALPAATFDVKWGADHVYSVGGKMFAVCGPDQTPHPTFSFKASDMAYEHLIEAGVSVPAPYLARAHWVRLAAPDALPDEEIAAYLAQAHGIVAQGLTKKLRASLGL